MSSNHTEIKLYFDGSCHPGQPLSAIGYTLETTDGDTIHKDSYQIDAGTTVETEFKALIHAVKAALEHGYTRIKAYGDCQSVINYASMQLHASKPSLETLQTTLRDLHESFNSIEYTHISRDSNQTADSLASAALRKTP